MVFQDSQKEALLSSKPDTNTTIRIDAAPDPEVHPKGKRRALTAAYKTRILREADACTKPGEIGALLRREGLYSSHLSIWRKQRDEGLVAQKRGRKKDPETAARREIIRLEHDVSRLSERLRKAELIIDVQKKVSLLLGNSLPTTLPSGEPI